MLLKENSCSDLNSAARVSRSSGVRMTLQTSWSGDGAGVKDDDEQQNCVKNASEG